MRARILELAEAGMAAASIAREVGLPKGEVELVHSVRKVDGTMEEELYDRAARLTHATC